MDQNQPNRRKSTASEICADFERRWRSGQQPLIEETLEQLPEQGRTALLHELVLLEWSLRVAEGQTPSVSEYCRRFPCVDLRAVIESAHQSGSRSDRPNPGTGAELDETEHSDHSEAAPLEDQSGPKQIGRYRVIKLLGKGGFGRVYLAHDERLRRDVAIKLPATELRAGSPDAEQYLIEARTLAELDHPNIVPVYDVGSSDTHPCFVVSKWIEGIDLSERLRQFGIPPFRQTVELVATVAEALQYAHSKKIIHRDIKPANILLDSTGRPYVADFGLALRDQDYGKRSGLAGTPAYMCPEQARGEGHLVDGRSDIFSLGVVFYELLTGERPFVGEDRVDVVRRIARLEVRPPRQLDRNIPKELQRICLKALAKRAADRYPTAADLVEDLRHWLSQEAEYTLSSAQGPTPRAIASSQDLAPSSSLTSDAVVPKGLRCFDGRDADFFLTLVPGPRDRYGLPDTIRRWKAWAEDSAVEDTQRVGVIYGPSGCGKSSLVRAGLLPCLSDSVLPLFIEASAHQTEDRLLKQLQIAFPSVPRNGTLTETLAEIRHGACAPAAAKVLIVLDQFEQWLQINGTDETAELVVALRQCDGLHVQSMLLVRDDFFLALTRFMSLLDVPLVQGKNMMLADLFDPIHARKVLLMFGRAYERLPAESQQLGREQELFLNESVKSLESGGKIFPVRLALFTEMVKGKPWTAGTVRALGGAEGIGTVFLEEAFSSKHAPAAQRIHETAARTVLESLLPDPGTELRGQRRTRDELLHVSRYDSDRFDELLNILDTQLRLITPTELPESELNGADHRSGDTHYQLSHDYLVPSVRGWITRQRAQSFRGRIRLQLAEHAAVWSARPEKRLLPSWTEWVTYRILLPNTTYSDQESALLRAATKRHAVRTGLLVSLLLIAAFSVFLALRVQKAKSLTNSLFTAELSNIPAILDEIEPYRRHVDGQLRQAAGRSEDVHAKLVSNLALVRWDDEATKALCQVALDCEPEAMLLVCDALISPGEEITEGLWQVLESDADHPERRFRAAQLLANIQPPVAAAEVERWMKRADFIRTRLVEACIVAPQSFDPLTRLLQPMSSVMIDSLASAVGEVERSADTVTKLNLLLRFLQPSPRELTRHCLGASQWQLPIVLAPLKESLGRDGGIADYLREVMTESPSREDSPEEREKTSRRLATAGALLAQDGYLAEVWPWLRRQPLPATRAYLIHRLQQLGLPSEILVQRLAGEQDSGIRTALILSLGQYDLPDDASKSAQLFDLVQSAYTNDPDPGVHAAAEWLLGRWDDGLLADLRSANSGPPPGARWRVNNTGHVMIRIDGRDDSRIGRVFEISSREVTLGQFLRFRPNGDWRRKFTADDEHPLGAATWNDAIAYCNYLSNVEGLESTYPLSQAEIEEGSRVDGWLSDGYHLKRNGYRLPTEAEWETACQAGAVTRTFFGDQSDLVTEYAWIAPGETNLRSQRCGILKPNDFGLFDTLGNVAEWCDDRNDRATTQRVLRGGNYRSFEWQIVNNESSSMEMITKYNSIGFRIARTVPVREAHGRGD